MSAKWKVKRLRDLDTLEDVSNRLAHKLSDVRYRPYRRRYKRILNHINYLLTTHLINLQQSLER